MNPFRTSDKEQDTPKRVDWGGIWMLTVTFCWGLALLSGGLFLGLILGTAASVPELLRVMLGYFAAVGAFIGCIGYVIKGTQS